MDLSHLHLHVRDRARSVSFYRRWFGLRISSDGDDITFMKGDRDFLFALMADPAPAPMPPWFHFGIELSTPEQVRRTLDEMKAADIPIVKPLYDDETLTSFRCADPDAYTIEVYASPADSAVQADR
jgi:catechol 2,3-dioxygenase-like lactoylglutathione lyase family enzyme